MRSTRIEHMSEKVQQQLLEAEQKCELEQAKAAQSRAVEKFGAVGYSLGYAQNAASKKQDEASVAYKAVERAMQTVVEREQEWEQARVELTIAFERVEQLEPKSKESKGKPKTEEGQLRGP